jgi:hypothetical protein
MLLAAGADDSPEHLAQNAWRVSMSIYDEYQIVINEGQRRVIMRALINAMANDRRGGTLSRPTRTNTCSLFACSARLNALSGSDSSGF